MPVSVTLHLGDHAPHSSSWIGDVSLSAGNQVDVSMIDRLPSCITAVRLDRRARCFLEIQPTVVSLLRRSLACCPCHEFSADGDDAVEFKRAASELVASEATMVLSEARGLWLFLVIREGIT